MKNLIFISLIFSGLSFSAIENVGSIVINKKTSSAIYMKCGFFGKGGDECQAYKVILVTQDSKKSTAINESVYPAILSTDDHFIDGKPMNLEDYNYTKSRLEKMKKNRKKENNGFKKAVLSTIFYPVAAFLYAGETVVDFPQNTYKKSKKRILDSRFKGLLTDLFHGDSNQIKKISNRKFKKLTKLLSEL